MSAHLEVAIVSAPNPEEDVNGIHRRDIRVEKCAFKVGLRAHCDKAACQFPSLHCAMEVPAPRACLPLFHHVLGMHLQHSLNLDTVVHSS